ncbi:MAG: hypothetical protein IPJ98_00195 [Bryobacterales bacterium]|nr:hypothetical protein [Bryobacterales bacterium]
MADLLRRSWSENPEPSINYTEEYLHSSFAYPGTSPELAPTVYEGGQPVAFVAGFPRTAQCGGQNLRLLVNTFLTADPKHKGKAFGAGIWTEFLKRAKAAGYDGTINFCVDGGQTNGIVVECGRRLNLQTEKIFSIPYLARLLRPAQRTEPIPATAHDIELFLELATEPASTVPLARTWSRPEAEWQCRQRTGALTVSLRRESRAGILTGTLVEVLGEPIVPSLLVEDVFWGSLLPEERLELVSEFCIRGSGAGAQMISLPLMGYADMAPFQKSGFRKSRRLIHVYMTCWTGAGQFGELPAIYMDVF